MSTDGWCICNADLKGGNYTAGQKVLFMIILFSTIVLGYGFFLTDKVMSILLL